MFVHLLFNTIFHIITLEQLNLCLYDNCGTVLLHSQETEQLGLSKEPGDRSAIYPEKGKCVMRKRLIGLEL